MIGLLREVGPPRAGPTAFAASLGLFAGGPADSERTGDLLLAQLGGPRAKPRPGWQAARSPSGWPVLFEGWIVNHAALAGDLNLPAACAPAALFGAAVECWGPAADARVVGTYAAIVAGPEGEIRLSRSPWSTRSLFYHASDRLTAACSIVRPLFAIGLPKRLRPEALERLLQMELPEDDRALFEGIDMVPQGSVVTLRGTSRVIERWYDPLAIPEVRFARDDDYVERASELLGESAASSLRLARKPGIALSGGLDSALVCAEVLRQLPGDRRLPSFTFHPLESWEGKLAPHKFGDDRPAVREFAAQHPRLDPYFVANHGIGFDDRIRQMFVACDAGYPARVSGSVYHGVYAAAAEHGCDVLLTADAGNLSFSSSAPWALREFARAGDWRALWQLVQANPFRARPAWRQVPLSIIGAHLPPGFEARLRQLRHHGRPQDRFANPFLRQARTDEARPGIVNTAEYESREQTILSNYHSAGLGNEMTHSFEQVFGLRQCDVAAYRPLIEFCFGLPTGQFNGAGQTRWLAKRMAKGRLPDAQRLDPRHGSHNVDWHARMTPRLSELGAEIEALARHPELAGRLDLAALRSAVECWPGSTPDDYDAEIRLKFFLPANLYIARFLDYVSGRNEG